MRLLGALTLAVVLAGCAGPAPRPATDPAPEPARATERATDPSGDDARPRRDLRLTSPPRVAWVDGSVLRLPDGGTVQLPRRWRTTSIVRYADGYLVTDDRAVEGVTGMHRLDAAGAVLDSWTTTGPALASRDGRVAWVSLVAPESGRTGPTLLHVDSVDGGEEVAQRLDRSRLPFLTGWFRGRLVHETWGSAASYVTDLVHPPRAVPRAADLGVLRPDGAYRARLGDEGLELLHHDGQLTDVIRVRGLGRTPDPGVVWEDDRHVLTTITRNGRQAVARIGMGGRVSLATPWRKAHWTGFTFLSNHVGFVHSVD